MIESLRSFRSRRLQALTRFGQAPEPGLEPVLRDTEIAAVVDGCGLQAAGPDALPHLRGGLGVREAGRALPVKDSPTSSAPIVTQLFP